MPLSQAAILQIDTIFSTVLALGGFLWGLNFKKETVKVVSAVTCVISFILMLITILVIGNNSSENLNTYYSAGSCSGCRHSSDPSH